MRPEDGDFAQLWDMLKYAMRAELVITGLTYAAYSKDWIRQDALERNLELVGEAARRVSTEFKTTHGEIPWHRIIAQRNVLAHDYGEIRHDRLWKTATEDAPELVRILKPLVPSTPPLPQIG